MVSSRSLDPLCPFTSLCLCACCFSCVLCSPSLSSEKLGVLCMQVSGLGHIHLTSSQVGACENFLWRMSEWGSMCEAWGWDLWSLLHWGSEKLWVGCWGPGVPERASFGPWTALTFVFLPLSMQWLAAGSVLALSCFIRIAFVATCWGFHCC